VAGRAARLIRIIAVGRLKSGPEAELVERYAGRIKPKLEIIEIPEGRGAPAEVKRRENEALLAALPAKAIVIALDPGGAALDSLELAGKLDGWLALARPVCCLIGGAEGLDAGTIARADATLSLGRMTWPHFLARAMLAEQIYRARAISAGHPYHREGRP